MFFVTHAEPMIKFSLTCRKSHTFEGWFPSGKGFDAQVKKKLVSCPVCGSAKVSKAMMAPSVVTSEQKTARRRRARSMEAPPETTPSPEPSAAQFTVSPEQRAMLKELRKMRDAVLAKSDYVGPRFAEEARRIHNEEPKPDTKARGIHGEATPGEVKSLLDDGIDVFPVPVLPDDQN